MRGYYEANGPADVLGLPVFVKVMNVMVNGIHWHDHVEILFCLKGRMHVRIEGEEYVLEAGDFVTVNSGCSHEIHDGEAGGLQIICAIEMRLLGEMKDKSIGCSTLPEASVGTEDAGLIRQALSEMALLSVDDLPLADWNPERGKEGKEPESWQQRLRAHPLWEERNWNRYHMYMYQLLMVLVQYKTEEKKDDRKKHEWMDRCVSYINEHFGEPLNAGILADRLHVSESTVYRLFSEQAGIPLNQYITTVRLNAVCRCLEETAEQVSAIAYDCGFTGLSNFYRVFQRYVGITPKEYRRSRKYAGTSLLFREPDIMKLNRYQSLLELGIGKEELLEILFL